MSDAARSRALLVLALIATAAARAVGATPAEITSFGWQGTDVVLTLSDSIASAIDLARSDTNNVVIDLRRAVIGQKLRTRTSGVEAAEGGLALSLQGPDGRTAVLSQRADGGTTLRIHDDTELGFALLWRPFARQVVVHTFTWSALSYGESQYYQGLIALEQRIDDQAEELLTIAASTGEPRAIAALGSWYARRGQDSLATRYLRDPRTADQHAALAAVLLRSGDTTSAERHEDEAEALLASGDASSAAQRAGPRVSLGSRSPEEDEILIARKRNAWVLVGFGVLGIALLGGFLWFASRRRRNRRVAVAPTVTAPSRVPPPPARETAGFRVVAREPVATEAPAATVADSQEVTPIAPTETQPESEPAPAADAPAEQDAAEPPTDSPEEPRVHEEAVNASVPATPPPTRTASPTPWTSAPSQSSTHSSSRDPLPTPTQVEELQTRLRAAEFAPRTGEPTVEAARRLGLSRDNVELRRRMEDAAARGRTTGPA